tara:strand:- start:2866 stop:3834 length:969 start_codon:yes stop_codon:yes gene_type:complete
MRITLIGITLTVGLVLSFGACSGGGAQGDPGDEVTLEQFDVWMTELSNWGRWGDDDELGAVNLITPEKRVAASRLVETGRTVSMSRAMELQALADHPSGDDSADREPVLEGSVRSVFGIDEGLGFFWERYEIEYHGGNVSHLDALCHVSYKGKVYNGRNFLDVASKEDGCSAMGIVNLKDGLVTRGVLLDMPGQSVKRQDIESWEEETGITISSGDALFLRTGRDIGQQGGYHPSLIPFFKERDIALLGSDVPQEGGQIEGAMIPIHFFTLVSLGVHLFDNLGLEDLAEAAREENRWEFMFMASPHVIPNGAGSAINPTALF